jgi:hypothetical protein
LTLARAEADNDYKSAFLGARVLNDKQEQFIVKALDAFVIGAAASYA